jgi:hypothetical protein
MSHRVVLLEAVINDYISKELVDCAYLRSRGGASQAGSRG